MYFEIMGAFLRGRMLNPKKKTVAANANESASYPIQHQWYIGVLKVVLFPLVVCVAKVRDVLSMLRKLYKSLSVCVLLALEIQTTLIHIY